MSRSWLPGLLIALALSAAAVAASAQQSVNFTSLDGTTNLTAHLSRPEGDAPRPALVLMHGCSGLPNAKGRILPIYQAWMRALVGRGNPVELKSYPSAVHGFDAPNLPRRELPAYRVGDGPIPVIGTDTQARADAFPRVLEFLKLRLESN